MSDYYRSTKEKEENLNKDLLVIASKKPSSEIKMKSSERKMEPSKKQSTTEKDLDKEEKMRKI